MKPEQHRHGSARDSRISLRPSPCICIAGRHGGDLDGVFAVRLALDRPGPFKLVHRRGNVGHAPACLTCDVVQTGCGRLAPRATLACQNDCLDVSFQLVIAPAASLTADRCRAICSHLDRTAAKEEDRRVDRDPLNFFQPFENLKPGHENQLTRALLLLLRLSPIAHEAWLARIPGSKRLWELPGAEFVTQRRSILIETDADEPLPLVSVFLTPHSTFDDTKVVAADDRAQVLDAIITYPREQVVVVENKITPADDWQAANINITGVAVLIAEGQKPVRILWPDLLADLNGLLEHNLVGGAERGILSDFLTYVEDHFPGLGPDQTLALCAGNEYRIERRLRSILSEALGAEARIDGWGPCVDIVDIHGIASRAYLIGGNDPHHPEEDAIQLSFSPADTITQARELYSDPKLVDGVRQLAGLDGWSASHNFHFGHMQGGYVWTSGHIDLGSYLDLWVEEIKDAGNIPREEWEKYFAWLVEKRIASSDDREEFDKHFTNTNRQTATPRPGLGVSRWWLLPDAEALDAAGKLVAQVAAAYQQFRFAFS
jgi:hypothetical protein